jgi:hypothetical protein
MGLAEYFYDGRTGEVTELTGEWNNAGMAFYFSVDPTKIESEVCGEDTIYYYNGDEWFDFGLYAMLGLITYSEEDCLMGDGDTFNGTTSTYTYQDPCDPYVKWVTGQFMASWTGSFYRASGLVWDSDGNIGWINVTGGGGGTPAIALGVGAGSSNANNISDLNGVGGIAGGSVGPEFVSVGADVVVGESYVGAEIGVNVGLQPYVEGHGILTHATVYPIFTEGQIIKFLDIFIENPY